MPFSAAGFNRPVLLAALVVATMLYSHAGASAVRIGLFRKEAPSVVRVMGPCVVTAGDEKASRLSTGRTLTLKAADYTLRARIRPASAGGVIRLVADGAERTCRGEIIVSSANGRLLVVNRLDVEDYVRSVLPGEMPHDWPAQALAAQAVVARSFALAKPRHASEGFDLCDLTHCQVYRGASWERPETDRATRMTAGQVLEFQGKCVPAHYHSTCGGKTTDGLYAGRAPEPFLQPVTEDRASCAGSQHCTWTTTLSRAEIKRALEADGHPIAGGMADIRVLSRDASGRVTSIQIEAGRAVRVTGYGFMLAVCRELGWNKIKSTLFEVRKSGGRFVFTGRGLGHGMGLCQWGAKGMAEKGMQYREILRHYYPRCRVERSP